MSIFLDWYSDGPGALLGLMLLSFMLLAVVVNGVRDCEPIAKMLPSVLTWHLVVFAFNAFWLLPFYGEGSDALGYHNLGADLASAIRDGAWGNIEWGLNTAAVPIIVGFLYAPFGANVYGALFFSAVLGLGGCIYFCRAFHLWASPAQTRRYSIIILFMPSISMWTGTFGKDSWIALGLGLWAYGYSSTQRAIGSKGLVHFIAGFAVTLIVRPHVALVMAASMVAAYLWGITQTIRGSAPMKLLRTVVLLAIVIGIYPVALNFLGLSDDAASNVDEYMRANGAANAEAGGSVVDVQVAPGIFGTIRAFPSGVVRVLLQPFPWEVHNFNAGLAALENLFVGWFLLRQATHSRELIRQVVRVPYLLFSGLGMLGLLMMFSLLPNLGLISRQRTQLLPFLFAVLVAAGKTRSPPPRFSRGVHLPRVAPRSAAAAGHVS